MPWGFLGVLAITGIVLLVALDLMERRFEEKEERAKWDR